MHRTSGILLHPTSLPGPFGIGDLGPTAQRFVDFLAAAGQGLWQMLPLGPTGYRDSPYQCTSAFAGNPLLISPERLVAAGWIAEADLDPPEFPLDQVDFGAVAVWKCDLLRRAMAGFKAHARAADQADYVRFCDTHRVWLDDYVLYHALKVHHELLPWTDWPPEFAQRDPEALADWSDVHQAELDFQRFIQYVFFRQWTELRDYARARGVHLIGDMPIFVAHDSSEVWTHPEWFELDERGHPTVIAGVPPDYFSDTGQRWGNPLYRWPALAADGYSFWIERLRRVLELVDLVRIDHFRGFAAYWEIPASEETAINGRWAPGPGLDLFRALRAALGEDLPLIAEDLGVITPDVEALRDELQSARHGGAAIRLRGHRRRLWPFGLPAAQPSSPTGRLHRHPRQQHPAWLVGRQGRLDPAQRPALSQQRRPGDPLGFHPRRARLSRRTGALPDAGCARTRRLAPA